MAETSDPKIGDRRPREVVDWRRLARYGRRMTKHGHSSHRKQSPEYVAWRGMIRRCHSASGVKNYSDRGITVCSRWRNSFPSFFRDMGPRPSPNHSIDRINNDGNYEPGNCRWATPTQQADNTRRSRRFSASQIAEIMSMLNDGRSLRDIGAVFAIHHSTLSAKLKKWGRSIPTDKPNRFVSFRGERLPLGEWARRVGISPGTLSARLSRGWTVKRALTESADEP